jgi:hypothetical protein
LTLDILSFLILEAGCTEVSVVLEAASELGLFSFAVVLIEVFVDVPPAEHVS